jgi:hypothetical protein
MHEMDGRGVRLLGNRLQEIDTATTVRVRSGEVVLADGPFAETKEQLGSVYVVDCASADDALALARRMPASPGLTIEIREIQEV